MKKLFVFLMVFMMLFPSGVAFAEGVTRDKYTIVGGSDPTLRIKGSTVWDIISKTSDGALEFNDGAAARMRLLGEKLILSGATAGERLNLYDSSAKGAIRLGEHEDASPKDGTIEWTAANGFRGYDSGWVSLDSAGGVDLTGEPFYTVSASTPLTNETVLSAGEGIDLSLGVISGEDASDVNKGIASFSSDDFSVSSGAVSLLLNAGDSYPNFSGSAADDTLNELFAAINTAAAGWGGGGGSPGGSDLAIQYNEGGSTFGGSSYFIWDYNNYVLRIREYTDTVEDAAELRFQRADAGQALVDDDDLLGFISFYGYDGDSQARGAYIMAHVDGVTGDGDMPTRLEFSTSADGSEAPAIGMTLDSSQKFSLTNGTGINEFSIDGTMAGDSDDAAPTEQAVVTYGESIIGGALADGSSYSNFSGSSDDDTINELFAAINTAAAGWGGGGGTPAGSDGAVQWNNGGVFGGDDNLFYFHDTNIFLRLTQLSDTAADRPELRFRRARVGPAVIQEDDSIGLFTFDAYDGSTYDDVARIEAFVDGVPGSGDLPGRLVFSVTPNAASASVEAMRIEEDRNMSFNTPYVLDAAPFYINWNFGGNSQPRMGFVSTNTSITSNSTLGEIVFMGVDGSTEDDPLLGAKIRVEGAETWNEATPEAGTRMKLQVSPFNDEGPETVLVVQPRIGTTSPSRVGIGPYFDAGLPSTAVLEVQDDTTSQPMLAYFRQANNASAYVRIQANNGYDPVIQWLESATWSIGIDGTDDMFKICDYTYPHDSYLFMAFDRTNDSIGMFTNLPATWASLDIGPTPTVQDPPTLLLKRDDAVTAADEILGRISFASSDGGTEEDPDEGAWIQVVADDIHANGDSPGRVEVWTTPDGSNVPVKAVTVDSTTYVGFGIGDPVYRVHVYGEDGYGSGMAFQRVEDAVGGPNLILMSADAGPGLRDQNDILGYIHFESYDGTAYGYGAGIYAQHDAATGVGDLPTKLCFATANDGSSTQTMKMCIANYGGISLQGTDVNSVSYAAAAAGKFRVAYLDENGNLVAGDSDVANND